MALEGNEITHKSRVFLSKITAMPGLSFPNSAQHSTTSVLLSPLYDADILKSPLPTLKSLCVSPNEATTHGCRKTSRRPRQAHACVSLSGSTEPTPQSRKATDSRTALEFLATRFSRASLHSTRRREGELLQDKGPEQSGERSGYGRQQREL